MARPLKQGLDYYPMDVHFFSDDKIEYVAARFDEKGELIAVKLLCKIYENGYYIDWNEDKAVIFAKRAGRNISPSLVKDVIGELVKRGFFDENIFNSFGILTSKGIQSRYIKIVQERKEVEIIADYWIGNLPQNDPGKKKQVEYIIKHLNNGINPGGNQEKPPSNSQSKGNESKGNKRKEDIPPNPPKGKGGKKSLYTEAEQDELTQIRREYTFSKSVGSIVNVWFQYKTERREPYKPTGFRQFLSRVQNCVNQHGEAAVIEVFESSMANGYKGVTFDNLQKRNKGYQTPTERTAQAAMRVLEKERMGSIDLDGIL